MKYPKYNIYEIMYKRYFDKGVNYLIDEANIKKDDVVLDLCGGNGRLTKELLKYAENVSYVDKEKDMIPNDLEKRGIKVYNEDINDFISHNKVKYTKVFCEQAINYWLPDVDIKKFSELLDKNGLFIFNTFSKKPSTKARFKEYVINNVNYLEISYLVKNKVEHIQICEGMEPHFTEFYWISEDEFREILEPYFEIKIKDNGKSALYVCRRK